MYNILPTEYTKRLLWKEKVLTLAVYVKIQTSV